MPLLMQTMPVLLHHSSEGAPDEIMQSPQLDSEELIEDLTIRQAAIAA